MSWDPLVTSPRDSPLLAACSGVLPGITLLLGEGEKEQSLPPSRSTPQASS